MHLLSLLSSLFTSRNGEKRDASTLAFERRINELKAAAMGAKLPSRAERARRARRILWGVWADRVVRGEESRSFGAFVRAGR
jgi:hypothetical protein